MNKPAKPSRRSEKATKVDECIVQALDSMLEQDENISYRAIVRLVEGVSAPSSVTRDNYRRSLVEFYQALQGERRSWASRIKKVSQVKIIAQLAAKDKRIEELERKIEILTSSHRAMILAVGELGGMSAWRRFYDGYSNALNEIRGILPSDISSILDLG